MHLPCAVRHLASGVAPRPLTIGRRPHAVQHPTWARSKLVIVPHAANGEDEPEEFEEEYIEEEDDGWIDEDVDDPSMRLYLDSANIKEWEKWAETGMFYGFTTNPTILKRDGVQCTLQAMRNLSRYADELEMEELQLQAWGLTWNDIYSCGLDLFELDSSRVVIKVPLTPAGVRAANRLLDDNVPVTFTGVYSAHQAVSAVSMGVNYVAPYLGRMNDAGKNGIEEIVKMQNIIDRAVIYDGDTRLLVASIRSADEIAELAAQGCNTFTISPAVAEQLVSDPLTIEAAELFQEHADEMGAMRDQ